jgi:predicted enzyme related to lactoylglutathione lyase
MAWRFNVTRTGSRHGSTWEAPTRTGPRSSIAGSSDGMPRKAPPEAGGYTVCDMDGKTVAGLGPNMNPAAPPHWSTYVNVTSADDTIAKVAANGGTVYMAPMDVMDAGRMAVFADPGGAALGLWQPGQHMGAQLVNEPGTYCWSELMTDDLEGAEAFYKAVFGWDAETQGPEGPGRYTEWQVGGRSVGGMMAKPPTMPPNTSFWGVYFAVEDTDAALAKAQDLGASVLMAATDIEPVRTVRAHAPPRPEILHPLSAWRAQRARTT